MLHAICLRPFHAPCAPQFHAFQVKDRKPDTDLVGRLKALAAEVTRVTLEVGSQGGQALVTGVEGVWFEPVWNVCYLLPSP
jgi:hypothetical protein